MNGYCYVYILETDRPPGRFYVGLTDNLAERLARHNGGQVTHTSNFLPWHIKSAVAFRDGARAAAFEADLKSSSGRAFAKKRL